MRAFKFLLPILLLLFCAACQHNVVIINDVEEREANEIIVFLASKGFPAHKLASPTTSGPAAQPGAAMLWSISVDSGDAVNAMAVLNRNGLPRKKSTTLLDLFAKSGLVSSQREEDIRYQAGLAAQIAGTIRKIDGVIDADVELSIPEADTGIPVQGAIPKRVTAAVYVKHQGVLDDPNSHLITKIKRLVAGSVVGLDINDVTVIADRSRFTDISLTELTEEITSAKTKEYVSIWSIIMNKASAARFRFIFFTLVVGLIVFALLMGWMIWKIYPMIRKRGGIRKLFNPAPFDVE